MNLKFEWDSDKAILNIQNHGISFEEAKTVFYDPIALNEKISFEFSAHAKQQKRSVETMKKTRNSKSKNIVSDDMLPEYNFDYSKARPNRFAERIYKDRLVVILDPDISQVFTNSESVNEILRALIKIIP